MANLTVPFIASTSVVFEPSFRRRPDAMLAMVPSTFNVPLIYMGPEGRLILTPLPDKTARSQALAALRQFISLVTFRRTIAPGEPGGRAFRIPLLHIFDEMPDDVVDVNLPSIAFLPQPGPGVHDATGIGGPVVLEETLGLYGDGTVVVSYGEYIEPFTIEIIAAKKAHRTAIMAGLEAVLRLVLESGTLQLRLPDYFGAVAEFDLTSSIPIDDPYVAQNRRRAHLFVTLTVSELWLMRGAVLLRPSVLIDIGTAEFVTVDTRTSVEMLAPELSAEVVASLSRHY